VATGSWSTRQANSGPIGLEIAHRLKGKHKPNYAPIRPWRSHRGDQNAGTVRVTGAKLTDKFYHQHTGYVGNLKSISLDKLLKEHPERAIEFAVKGMLPKGPLAAACTRAFMCSAARTIPTKLSSQSAGNLEF